MTRPRRLVIWSGLLLGGAGSLLATTKQDAAGQPGAGAGSAFSQTTIDLGLVVRDVEKSVGFYRDAVGFSEVPGFSVSGEFCRDAGLTDTQPLTVRVLVLGEGETATKLKVMSVPATRPAEGKNEFVHSQLGYSYLTIHVKNLATALERAKGHGVTAISRGPIPLNPAAPDGMGLAVIRDPDGNLVELLGPMKD